MDSYLLFASIWFVAAVTPGADTMLLLTTSLSSGWKSAIPISIGISAAKIVLLIATYFGLNFVLSSIPQLFVILQVFGCAFLLWRAFKLWNSNISSNTKNASGFFANLTLAFSIAVSNPQALLFYIAVVPQVSQSTNPWVLSAVILVGFTFVSAIYISLANPIRVWISKANNTKLLNRIVSILFAAIATYLALHLG